MLHTTLLLYSLAHKYRELFAFREADPRSVFVFSLGCLGSKLSEANLGISAFWPAACWARELGSVRNLVGQPEGRMDLLPVGCQPLAGIVSLVNWSRCLVGLCRRGCAPPGFLR